LDITIFEMVTIAGVTVTLIIGTTTSAQAKDLYTFPSARDGRGLTILEPIACSRGQILSYDVLSVL
jgi:hypothetical protein